MILWFAAMVASAADIRPVREGDTVESIAAQLGDAALAETIRTLNALKPGDQPTIGTLLQMPDPAGTWGEQQAFLIALSGDGTFTDVKGTNVPAQTWTPVPSGTTVCTGTNAFATLRLASTCDETGQVSDDIQLNPETCLSIDAAISSSAGRSSVLTVTRGSVAVSQVPDGQGHVTVVTTAGITTGAKGGFRVTVEENAARTEALYAEVAVQGAGAEVKVDRGQGSRVKEGEVPSDPIDLLETGPLLTPDPGAPLMRPAFLWEPVRGALGYRFEIATSVDFRELLFQEDVEHSTFVPPVLMLPTERINRMYWRVASFDRFGFLGVPTEPRELTLPARIAP